MYILSGNRKDFPNRVRNFPSLDNTDVCHMHGRESSTSGSCNPIEEISSAIVVSVVTSSNVFLNAIGEKPKYRLNALEKDCGVSYPTFSDSS